MARWDRGRSLNSVYNHTLFPSAVEKCPVADPGRDVEGAILLFEQRSRVRASLLEPQGDFRER